MTRKDYKKIGKILNKQWFSNSLRFNNDFYISFSNTINEFIEIFKQDNKRFNERVFRNFVTDKEL
tara:strand:+ start:108 stop:302 length:195 start_codon:yes stop_codon:yes gene_type:complete